MYSNKNPNGFVVRAGLADPFAVAIAAGLGADGQRYPIIPILDGFGLLVSESIKQGSLSNAHFMVLGIETSSWEGLTHQPGTSANTALRNLPDKPLEKWGDTGEFGVYHYYPCHPKESAIIFEDCCNTHKLAYLKMTSYQPEGKWDIFFDVLPDDVYLKGGYILGPSYDKPDLVILTAGREVFSCLEVVEQLRKEYPLKHIQLSVISLLNLPVSLRPEDKELMERLSPFGSPILRVSGLPQDALGISIGSHQKTLATKYLTQSSLPDELAHDQGYDFGQIMESARELLKV